MYNRKTYIKALTLGAVFYFSPAYAYNYQLREEGVTTFTNRIARQITSPINLIGEYIDFLDEKEDSQAIEQYKDQRNFDTFYNKYTTEIDSTVFKDFADKCLEIYKMYDNFVPPYQAAAGMMLERVGEELKAFFNSPMQSVRSTVHKTLRKAEEDQADNKENEEDLRALKKQKTFTNPSNGAASPQVF